MFHNFSLILNLISEQNCSLNADRESNPMFEPFQRYQKIKEKSE